jgi:hypothetical protein
MSVVTGMGGDVIPPSAPDVSSQLAKLSSSVSAVVHTSWPTGGVEAGVGAVTGLDSAVLPGMELGVAPCGTCGLKINSHGPWDFPPLSPKS